MDDDLMEFLAGVPREVFDHAEHARLHAQFVGDVRAGRISREQYVIADDDRGKWPAGFDPAKFRGIQHDIASGKDTL